MGMRARIAWAAAALALLASCDAEAQFMRGPAGGGFHSGPAFHGGGFGFHPGYGPPTLYLDPDDYEEDDGPRRPPPAVQFEPNDNDDAPQRSHRPAVRRTLKPMVARERPAKIQPPAAPSPRLAAKPPKPAPLPAATAAAPRARPPLAETRFRPAEVVVEVALTTSPARVIEALRRHRLSEAETINVDLLGLQLRRWIVPDGRSAVSVIAELAGEGVLLRIQPNYVFSVSDQAAAPSDSLAASQYALAKMKVAPGLEDAGGTEVRVAVIDTAIDETHPDLAGVVAARFDGLGGPVLSKSHGTAMAGGIAANGRLHGVATRSKILSARAFDIDGATAVGSTLTIIKSLDWAAKQKANVVNMSFAGPDDPTLRDALAAASARGIALVGAAGNAGSAAPPQYPGADAHVIAATATDADDKLFAGANVGAYVAISAPGVDVLLPAPGGGYAMETGTSVSSALVAGVVALMLQHDPNLAPDEIRRRLAATAAPLGGVAHAQEFGAGLVDATRAVGR
jgi:subtilisin family serine protease